MPFIGQDWRSPGEAWVKTETLGWQRMKIIESQLYRNCHQSSSACSWPPRSDYGQHMDNNCSRPNVDDTASPDTAGEPAMRTGSLSSSEATSPASSAASSRGGSLSPTPSSSPEKNTHHIHPIAISSPYGWHSCFAHHPATAVTNCCANKDHHHHHHHHHQQSIMSRSLSKESLVSAGNNLESRNSLMRYNRSVSDFRNAPSDSETPKSDNGSTRSDVNGCVYLSPPTLMKNGLRIDPNNDDDHHLHVNVDERTRSLSETTTTTGYHVSPEIDGAKQNGQMSTKPVCCCCSTTGTGAGASSGSACNFYPLREPSGTKTAPHCRISVRTREVAMYNTISEAFYRLDFCNAIHDIRRFNYICKLLHLLITQNLTSLSGCATRVLFNMLEQVAWEVSSNKRNIHILKNLLKELRQMIEKNYCWGRPIGSSLLWQQHFETIERISHIVEGIELAPSKSSTEQQASFNDLPVEMIREILLRLNDYRDLVNSAQASPVMQIMIDNQVIWQKLCKYHFTEQQLKLALENRSNYKPVPSSIKQRTNNVQGIKYARTASADGRTSYRNPVNPKDSTATATAALKSKEDAQLSDAGSSNNHRQRRNQTTGDARSSYVTRAIRIFDREGSSATLSTGLVRQDRSEISGDQPPQVPAADSTNQRRQSRSVLSTAEQETGQQQATSNTNNLRSSSALSRQNIDWERVFHQLRKKFDLKEEYPDCLLLCRHCRCLFWKSFGHPCIKTDDTRLERGQQSNNNAATCHRSALSNRIDLIAQVNSNNGEDVRQLARGSGRPSVADLSRNFSGQENRASDTNNMRPSQAAARRNSGNNCSRLPLSANLEAADLLRLRPPRQQVPLREDNHNMSSQRTGASSSAKRDELIPKHVAISPQAFLKFFSL